nr:phage tail protein [uncultured Mucilaginibacter sp.]
MENENLKVTTASVTAIIQNLPIGIIMPFGGSGAKVSELKDQGWLLCDGRKESISDYKKLHDVIGNACGDGGTHFFLPDLRSVFLRGVDGVGSKDSDPDSAHRTAQQAGGNTGNNVLTRQAHELYKHTHSVPAGPVYVRVERAKGDDEVWFERFEKPAQGARTETSDIGGRETRPVNVSVNYIIFAGIPGK